MISPTRSGHRSPTFCAVLLSAVSAAFAAGCSGGGGGGGGNPVVLLESEPNGTPAQANALALERTAVGGVVTAGDVDCFSVNLVAGRYARIELFGTRFDQAAWDAAANVPRLTLLAPDGTTKVLEHDPIASVSDGWGWGEHDLDFPLFRVPATGKYFVCVAQGDSALAGGEYALRVGTVNLAAAQQEFEPAGTTGANDTPNTSQDIQPGTVHGFHVDDELDFYAVTITAPTVVRFAVTAYRDGVHDGDDGYLDLELQLYGQNGSTVFAFDDDSFFFDPAIHFELLNPGTYFLEVGEVVGLGDGDYLLTYSSTPTTTNPESEPNDVAATANPIAYGDEITGAIDTAEVDLFAFSGTAGDMVRLQVFDAWNTQNGASFVTAEILEPDGVTVQSSGGFFGLQTVTTILQQDGTHYVRVLPSGSATGYRLELERFQSAAYETEPNDTMLVPDLLMQRAAGVILAPSDVDVFQFDALEDRLAVIAIFAGRSGTASDGGFEYSGHGSILEPRITVTDGGGGILATSTSTPVSVFTESVTDELPTAAVAFVPTVPGPYYLHVESAPGTGDAQHTYVVQMR